VAAAQTRRAASRARAAPMALRSVSAPSAATSAAAVGLSAAEPGGGVFLGWMYRLPCRCWLVGCAARCGAVWFREEIRRARVGGEGDYGNRLIIAVCAWAVALPSLRLWPAERGGKSWSLFVLVLGLVLVSRFIPSQSFKAPNLGRCRVFF
jgi:hypothetical protein